MGDITLFEVHLDGEQLQLGTERIGDILSDIKGKADASSSTGETTTTDTGDETSLADKTEETGPNLKAAGLVVLVVMIAIALAAVKFRSKPASELEALDSN